MKMVKKYVNFTKKSDGAAILLSDNHECALPHKGHMMFSQNMTPQKQYEFGCDLFAPITNNIVGACTGNHAARAQKVAGLDMDRTMADRLGYLDRYFPHQGFIEIKVGKINYKIAFKHGQGVGSDSFRNCKQLLRGFPEADICASSHTHECSTTKVGKWTLKGGKRVFREITFATTGSSLDFPSYADEAGYPPQPKGFTILWLDPEHKRVSVDCSGII